MNERIIVEIIALEGTTCITIPFEFDNYETALEWLNQAFLKHREADIEQPVKFCIHTEDKYGVQTFESGRD